MVHGPSIKQTSYRRASGPARPLRFRVTGVTETSVVIGEVEEDVLLFF